MELVLYKYANSSTKDSDASASSLKNKSSSCFFLSVFWCRWLFEVRLVQQEEFEPQLIRDC